MVLGGDFPGGFQMATVLAGPLAGEKVCIDAEVTNLGWCVCELPCFTDHCGKQRPGPLVAVRREHLHYWSRVEAVYGPRNQQEPP
jgi:hypothetical protein